MSVIMFRAISQNLTKLGARITDLEKRDPTGANQVQIALNAHERHYADAVNKLQQDVAELKDKVAQMSSVETVDTVTEVNTEASERKQKLDEIKRSLGGH